MRMTIIRLVVSAIFALGLAIPGAAIAGGGGKNCSIQGTWFGVNNFDDLMPSGWVVTATGRSNDHGVNVLEFPTYDLTFGGLFSQAVEGSANRGVWRRTGGRTFDYSFTTMVVDANRDIVYMTRVKGTSTLGADCMSETITAYMEVFLAGDSIFDENAIPILAFPLPTHYGYRYTLE